MTPMPFFQPPPEPEPTHEESARFYRTPWDPPDNALPGLGPSGLLLARTPTTAVHLAVTGAYPDGLGLQVQAFFHPDHPYGPLTRPPRRPTQPMDDLRLGLQWPDGTRAEAQPAHQPPTGEDPSAVRLFSRGGGGGGIHWRWELWLRPLPAPGPVTVYVQWEPRGIPETAVPWDLAPFVHWADQTEELWPLPDLPTDTGWIGY
jgi:hypothetical protein